MKLIEVVSRRSFLEELLKVAGFGLVSLLLLPDDVYAKNGSKKGKLGGGKKPPGHRPGQPPGSQPGQPPENRPENPPENMPEREKSDYNDNNELTPNPCDRPENWGKPPCEHLVPKNN